MKRALVLSTSLLACGSEPHAHHGGDHGHHQSHGMPHTFDDAEQWAKVFDDPERDAWQRPDEVVAILKIEPGMTVADLGAGTGYFMSRLSRAVGPEGNVLALDVEPNLVKYMTERGARESLLNVEARLIQPGDPALPAGSVDRILIVDTWHHIEGRGSYSKKLAAALRPGGSVVIVDFTMESEKGPPKEHRIGPDGAAKELAEGGLVAKLAEEQLPDQYVLIATR